MQPGSDGNSYWHKPAADHQVYDKERIAVFNAVTALTNQSHTFEIVGLLYLQGESNNTTEPAEAGSRFRLLLDNLRADLPNASGLRGYIAGIKVRAGSPIPLARHAHNTTRSTASMRRKSSSSVISI